MLVLVYFLSGTAGLVYEVLWLKWLALLFGSTAHASATVLSVFFLGLSAGGWFWGRRARDLRRPLQTYGLLEIGIAASALASLLLADGLRSAYALLYAAASGSFVMLTLVKFVLAILVLFVPAFFMGGTFPVMGQLLIRSPQGLGRTGSLLYGTNTIGAAVGAVVAGFVLLPAIGLRGSYLCVVSLNALIGVAALFLGRQETGPATPVAGDDSGSRGLAGEVHVLGRLLRTLAFASGFAVLALEVLWTRMFSQVLHNSVYSFTVILVSFLVALALGSLAASGLSRLRVRPEPVLVALVLASGVAVALTPRVFFALTGGLRDVSSSEGFGGYIASIVRIASIGIFLPGILMGTIFPFLFRMSEKIEGSAGRTLGALTAINGIGGILGSLCAGFVLLEAFGLWTSILLIAALYCALVLVVPGRISGSRVAGRAAFAVLPILVIFVARLGDLPAVHLDEAAGERMVESWEGSMGTVAVVSEGEDLRIKVDNYYRLGGVGGFSSQQRQAQIPLFILPNPRSVFFLGLGTGISAGAALDFPVGKVLACELIPEVVVASRRHFGRYTNGLYQDPRATIVADDGRAFLQANKARYDLIISDLFVPWQAGTGSLYTLEHFRLARARLEDHGTFVQWVPLCQMSRGDFGILARTILEVFPHATFWRGEFVPSYPTACIVCSVDPRQLDPQLVMRNVLHVLRPPVSDRVTEADAVPYILYAGNLGACRDLFAGFPLNTDDHPRIEYGSPRTHLRAGAGETSFLMSFALLELVEDLFRCLPPEEDPFLDGLTERQVGFVRAGQQLYEAGVYVEAGRPDEARPAYRSFLRQVPFHVYPGLEN